MPKETKKPTIIYNTNKYTMYKSTNPEPITLKLALNDKSSCMVGLVNKFNFMSSSDDIHDIHTLLVGIYFILEPI